MMGTHTMHDNEGELTNLREGMRESRDSLVELCATNNLEVTNTMFRKPVDKIATYRKTKETDNITHEPITKGSHEQLDYTLTPRRL